MKKYVRYKPSEIKLINIVKVKRKFIDKLNYMHTQKKLFINLNVGATESSPFAIKLRCMTTLKYFFRDYNEKIKSDYLYAKEFLTFMKNSKCVPFWTDSIKLLSDNLFLPIEESLTKTKNIFKNLWFTSEFYKAKENNNLQKLEVNSSIQNEIKITKTRQITLFLSEDQKIVFKNFLSAYRYVYNRTICCFSNYNKLTRSSFFFIDCKDVNSKVEIQFTEDQSVYNFYNLREILKDTIYPEWFKKINLYSHVMDSAIHEAVTNITTNFKQGRPLKMQMKTKKDQCQTLLIEKCYIKKNGIFPLYKYNDKYIFRNIRMKENIDKFNYTSSSITYHKILGTFTLNLGYTEEIKQTTQMNKKKKICAIDQGVREFVVTYSDTSVCKIGINPMSRIFTHCKEIDIIQSRMNKKEYYEIQNGNKVIYKVNSKRKRQLRRAMHRKIKKIKNLVKELHYQTANYLCKKYKRILLPSFETQEMARKLHSKTARAMMTLSFYKFKMIMNYKGKELNCEIIDCSEAYTSKTCTKCGNINYDLQMTDAIYKCSKCNLKIDRNFAGARNIALKNY